MLTVSLTILLLALMLLALLLRRMVTHPWGIFHVGIDSLLIIAVYIIFTRLIYRRHAEAPSFDEETPEYMAVLWMKFIGAAAIVVISGLMLARLGDEIAQATGLSHSTLLARKIYSCLLWVSPFFLPAPVVL